MPGSFPWTVLHERHPALVEKVRGAFPYGPAQHAALDALAQEIADDRIAPPAGELTDWPHWRAEHLGRRWGEVSFLWAENYFYWRLLGAVGYFGGGVGGAGRGGSAWRGVDPFEPFKTAELRDLALVDDLAALDRLTSVSAAERDEALLAASLWGNRADLGFRISVQSRPGQGEPGATVSSDETLVADDRARFWQVLDEAGTDSRGRVVVVADNAGHELLPDLVLVDHLLASGRAGSAELHVKPRPYFVSDATTADVVAGLRRLAQAGGVATEVAGRLRDAAATGRFTIWTDAFYCAPLGFQDMPDRVAARFEVAVLTVLKGDLNYRRLLADRGWPAATSFTDLTGYFPGAVAALRILKSDVAVGLDPLAVTELDASGQAWRTSGTRALVQVRPAGTGAAGTGAAGTGIAWPDSPSGAVSWRRVRVCRCSGR